MNAPQSFGEWLRHRRRDLDLTQEALANALDDHWHKAFALLWAGNAALSRKETQLAQAYLDQSLALWVEVGDRLYIGWTLVFLGEVALVEDNTERARALFESSIQPLRDAADLPMLAIPIRRLGQLALGQGDWAAAAPLFMESLEYNWPVRDYRGTATCLAALAAVCMARGALSEAAFGEAWARGHALTREQAVEQAPAAAVWAFNSASGLKYLSTEPGE